VPLRAPLENAAAAETPTFECTRGSPALPLYLTAASCLLGAAAYVLVALHEAHEAQRAAERPEEGAYTKI
jgi:hypothetical protein